MRLYKCEFGPLLTMWIRAESSAQALIEAVTEWSAQTHGKPGIRLAIRVAPVRAPFDNATQTFRR